MLEKLSKNLIPLAIIIAGILIAGSIIYVNQEKTISPEGSEEIPKSQTPISIENEPVLGNPNSSVTIIEFSDFQCPFCARYALETFLQIKKEYVDTGKVKIIFKNFPLTFHENAEIAGQASECALEQDKFWEYKEKLFENQANLAMDDLKKYAQDLLLDIEQFGECLDSEKFKQEVKTDFQEGVRAGVEGTPTFFINEEKLVGAQSFSEFQRIIEEKLKTK